MPNDTTTFCRYREQVARDEEEVLRAGPRGGPWEKPRQQRLRACGCGQGQSSQRPGDWGHASEAVREARDGRRLRQPPAAAERS